jgi:hypothetical protein
MKKIFLTVAGLSFLLAFLFSACKKDKDDSPAGQDAETLLLNKNWKLVSFTINPAIDLGNGNTNDVLSSWDDCEKDDLYIFKANGVFVWDEGASLCFPGDPQQSTATWSYNKSNKQITYCLGSPGACDSYTWTLTDINDTQFKVTGQETFGGTTYTENLTFTRQ